MLVLTPKFDEEVHIGNDVTVKIYPKDGKILMAITAPKSLDIWRGKWVDKTDV